MPILSPEVLSDMLIGCTILGTGGGGDPSEGKALIDSALSEGKVFDLVPLDDVPDTALVCTPYMLGAISALSDEEQARFARLPQTSVQPILTAYEAFQDRLRTSFYGTVPCEMGGSNTFIAMYAAAMNGHKIIDADPAGRAVPEITHSTYYLAGLPASPIVLANAFGEVMVLENVVDDMRAEELVRALSVVSASDIAAIDHALPARTLRSALIPGTLTKAIALGAAQRSVAPHEAADAVAEAGHGAVVFRGEVAECEWRTSGGFTLGAIEISNHPHRYRVSIKNENMAGWLDGKVHATIPDLICLLDEATGLPVNNPNAYRGQKVAVVVLPAPSAFLTDKGLSVFGPTYAGVDEPFQSPL